MGLNKNILLTRDRKDNQRFKQKLEKAGAKTYVFSCIKIVKNSLSKDMRSLLNNIQAFDWIIFTSAHGVSFFLDYLKDERIDTSVLATKKIGVVGSETANILKNHHLPVQFIPSQYLTEKIAEEIGDVKNSNILLLRSNIASDVLTTSLRNKGADVVNIPIYKTEFLEEKNDFFKNLINNVQLDYITFTSSSTVTGFLNRVTLKELQEKAYGIKVLAIGPVTAETARRRGFKHVILSDTFTLDGMYKKLLGIA